MGLCRGFTIAYIDSGNSDLRQGYSARLSINEVFSTRVYIADKWNVKLFVRFHYSLDSHSRYL